MTLLTETVVGKAIPVRGRAIEREIRVYAKVGAETILKGDSPLGVPLTLL